MKTLGLIGGTSWHATLEYYREINRKVSEKRGDGNNPELVLYSINIDIMRKQVFEDIQQKYLDVSKKLVIAGSDAIVICANTPHEVLDYVQPQIEIPFLHIADATAEEAHEKSFNSVGLLGTKPTMTKPFLKNRLSKKHNLKVEVPDDQYINKIHDYIANDLTQGKFTQEAKDFFCQQIQLFKDRNIDAVILGCTEIPILLKEMDTALPRLSTTDLHIDMAVDFILES